MPDNVIVTDQPGSILKDFLNRKKYSAVSVLIDENTRRHCYPVIKESFGEHHLIEVKSGEENKNLATCEYIWNEMTKQSLDRHSIMIILGGGVLGDMGGFCAATFKRGIDFILIPTTLLSQVDASIGGKLGIDFQHYKNHIGVFQLPALTLINPGFLTTLSTMELRSGFAEVIKHTLTSDPQMWNLVRSKTLEQQDWLTLLNHSVEYKSRVTTEDPKEKGVRKILNAGHTIGHAIETYSLQSGSKIMHGEAVAAGLICEAFIAKEKKMLSSTALEEISQYIITTFGKVNLRMEDIDQIFQLTLQDKKNKGNKILCVLLDGIGKARWDIEISQKEIIASLAYYQDINPKRN